MTAALPLLLSIACNNNHRIGKANLDVVSRKLNYENAARNKNVAEERREAQKTVSADSAKEKEFNTEEYAHIEENKFLAVTNNPLSTFSIDVDAASYSNVRRFLQQGTLPPPGAVRIEELINYFDYEYPQPKEEEPFSVNTEMSACPWNSEHRLLLVGLQGKKIPMDQLPSTNLVFLIDVSGSMNEEDKLPLVKTSLKMLTDQLRDKDRVAIVVYAGNTGLVLPSTEGSQKQKIKDAIDRLEAGGSTAGAAGLELAYKIAQGNFIKGGNNRIVLATDGDFNVGPSSDDELVAMIEKQRKTGIFLSILGFGMGNLKDEKMEQLADKGNGNHYYIDNGNEARKVLVKEFGGTLFTIAKDVKIQVEFNPAAVQSYRLIGYENRMLAAEDFNNDQKDAGELGSGHRVTALYELIPVGVKDSFTTPVDPLKYQSKKETRADAAADEWLTIKLRYKQPDGDVSKLITHPVGKDLVAVENASANLRFAASVAEFGMLLRNSAFKEKSSWQQVSELANGATGTDPEGYRREFAGLTEKAATLSLSKK